jgi:CSLREA domain-containing protein
VPSTLTVTTSADETNPNDGVLSLREAIAAAHNGDTIVFAPSLDGQTITLTSGELLIKHNVTIAGPGAGNLTISGNNASRVFEVANPATATLSGLTISNGSSPGTSSPGGGAILVDTKATATVSNCTLTGNSSPQGGAIHNDGTLTVIGSTLTGNSAGNYGFGGAIENNGTLTVSASTLSYNSAQDGGGIFVTGGTATVNAGTTLSGNSAYNGGGICADFLGTLMLNGCTLSGNLATHGGGLFVDNGTVTFSGCTLTGNSATVQGGGIFTGGGTGSVTVKDSSSITGNSAPAGQGADVYNYGVLYLDSTSKIGVLNGNPATPI